MSIERERKAWENAVTAYFAKNANIFDIKRFCEDNGYELEIYNNELFRLNKVIEEAR